MKIIIISAILVGTLKAFSKSSLATKSSTHSSVKSKEGFFGDGLYESEVEVMSGASVSLAFFAGVQPQDTYYFFQDDRTEYTKDPLGIVGSSILCNDDNENCFLPYYFISDCKVESENGQLVMRTPEKKLEEILGQMTPYTFRFTLLNPEEKRNSADIAKKLVDACKNAFKIYNDRVKEILEMHTEIVRVITELSGLRQELLILKNISNYQFKMAKVNLMKLSIKKTLKMKLDEMEVQEKDHADMVTSLAEWLYINDDWVVYQKAMGLEEEETSQTGQANGNGGQNIDIDIDSNKGKGNGENGKRRIKKRK